MTIFDAVGLGLFVCYGLFLWFCFVRGALK